MQRVQQYNPPALEAPVSSVRRPFQPGGLPLIWDNIVLLICLSPAWSPSDFSTNPPLESRRLTHDGELGEGEVKGQDEVLRERKVRVMFYCRKSR